MNNLREPLALGFELSGFFFVSYLVHKQVDSYLGWGENLTLTLLLSLSLFLWTIHAWVYASRKK